MGKKINIGFTELEFEALIELVDSASAIFDSDPIETKNVKLVDRALLKSGHKRLYK